MAVAKNKKTGKWYAKFRYRDYRGQVHQKKKEGFEKKADALTDYRYSMVASVISVLIGIIVLALLKLPDYKKTR